MQRARYAAPASRRASRRAGAGARRAVLQGVRRRRSTAPARRSPRSTRALREHGIFGGHDLSGEFPELGRERALLRHRGAHAGRHRPARRRARGGAGDERARRILRPFHQARWNEPIVLEQSSPGERGLSCRREPEPRSWPRPATALADLPAALRRTEPAGAARSSRSRRCCATTCGSRRRRSASDVEHPPRARHLHDEVQPARSTRSSSARRKVADLHPDQDDETVQGMLEAMHRFERVALRDLRHGPVHASSRAAARRRVYANARMIRAYHAARGEAQRDEIITTIFSHPCDGAGPATAGFKVITLYPATNGLPEPRRGQGRRLGADRRADDHESRGHRDLQPAHRPRSSRSSTRRAASATTTRRTRTASSASRAPATPASTSASSTCTRPSRRRTARWGCRCGASGVTAELAPLPAGADGRARRRRATTSTTTGRTRSARCGRSTACRRPSCARYAWVLALGRRGAARGGRDRRAQQQLPREAGSPTIPGIDVSYADGNADAPSRADPLQPGAAAGGDRRRRRSTSLGGPATSASRSTSRATSRGSSRSR